MKPHLNIQFCFYPFLDGGFYFSGPGTGPSASLNRMIRIGLGMFDIRLWWVGSLVMPDPKEAIPLPPREPGDGV